MSVRVGHILRNADVHGVSGEGKVADVFEASNGVCIVVWRSPHSSTNVYNHIKDVETVHSHGGKSLVVWDYESPPEPDPMEAVVPTAEAVLSEAEIKEIGEDAREAAEEAARTTVAERLEEAEAENEPKAKKPAAAKKTPKKKTLKKEKE